MTTASIPYATIALIAADIFLTADPQTVRTIARYGYCVENGEAPDFGERGAFLLALTNLKHERAELIRWSLRSDDERQQFDNELAAAIWSLARR